MFETTVSPGGLIHVSEFATTLCVAYLGIDALGGRKDKVREIADHISAVNDHLLNRLQPVKGGALQISFDCDELYMLAHVTRRFDFLPKMEQPRKTHVKKWAREVCPLLWYFLDRRDLLVITAIFLVSILTFFASTLAEIAEVKIYVEAAIALHLFFVLCCIWIFASVFASFKIPRLPFHIEDIKRKIEMRLQTLAQESVDRSLQEVQKSRGATKAKPRRARPMTSANNDT